tara:strand:+ start:82 stop:255 length:174 start_codon:yes stop_codon:yes gene_type:complete
LACGWWLSYLCDFKDDRVLIMKRFSEAYQQAALFVFIYAMIALGMAYSASVIIDMHR